MNYFRKSSRVVDRINDSMRPGLGCAGQREKSRHPTRDYAELGGGGMTGLQIGN
jgi:hypothetical protein